MTVPHRTRIAEVCAELNAEGAKYVLVGAAAMQLWGTTRATRDVDMVRGAWCVVRRASCVVRGA